MKNGICRPFLQGTTSLVDKLITRLENSLRERASFGRLCARSRGLMGRRRSICGGAPESNDGRFRDEHRTAAEGDAGDPDPVTCHWPHWLPVNPNDPGSNWHLAAYYNSGGTALRDGTYEAVGPHFQSNPYALNYDFLEKHGKRIVKDAPRDFEGLREYLGTHNFEGLVFWKDGEPRCKIKRSDFGFKWPDKTLRVEF